MAGERGGLARDALHHAAVPGERVDVVIEHLEAGTVEMAGHPLPRDRHADAGGDALAERPRRRLDPRRPAVLGVTGALAVELAKALDVIERDRELTQALVLRVHRLDACEVEHRVEQHRGVADREHEPIAVRPDRVVGIEPQEALPERVDDGRHGHRGPGVARVRLLDGVHREGADRVDRELVVVHAILPSATSPADRTPARRRYSPRSAPSTPPESTARTRDGHEARG